MPVKPHPFYCFKKGCRKTAWQTPEYLDEKDWVFLRQVLSLLEARERKKLHHLLYGGREGFEITKKFFYCALGWPEGLSYCRDMGYFKVTGFEGLLRHLSQLKAAMETHDGIQRVQ